MSSLLDSCFRRYLDTYNLAEITWHNMRMGQNPRNTQLKLLGGLHFNNFSISEAQKHPTAPHQPPLRAFPAQSLALQLQLSLRSHLPWEMMKRRPPQCLWVLLVLGRTCFFKENSVYQGLWKEKTSFTTDLDLLGFAATRGLEKIKKYSPKGTLVRPKLKNSLKQNQDLDYLK